MKYILILITIISPLITYASDDIKRLCSPQTYASSMEYWNALLKNKLVNEADLQAKNAVLKDENFAERIQVYTDEINLFGTTENEIVVKISFDYSSYYIHFFQKVDGYWFKTDKSLDFHLPRFQQRPNRLLDLTFKEIYKKGEYVLLIEKTTSYADGDNYSSWWSIWRIFPKELTMLHNQKFTEKSYDLYLQTEVEIDDTDTYPKTMTIEIKKEVYSEHEETGEVSKKISARIEQCQFESKTCHCKEAAN